MTEDDVKVCNCAGCGKELLGESMKEFARTVKRREKYPPIAKGRILGRPYCGLCLKVQQQGRDRKRSGKVTEEPSPSLENAVRALEEG